MLSFVLAAALFVTNPGAQSTVQKVGGDLSARARAVLTSIVAKESTAAEGQFNHKMTAALPPGTLASAWANILAQAGAYKGCSDTIRAQTTPEYDIALAACEFERGKVDAQIAFDKDGRI